MAFNYKFTLNGETLDATIGAMTHDKLEEAMDEGAIHLPITTLGFPKKILGLLNITVEQNSQSKKFDYLIISDEVELVSRDGFYSHNLTALEYTHKLDKYFVSALTFTKPFLRKTRAPFKFIDNSTLPQATNGYGQILPTVQFEENYLSNESIIIPRVESAYIYDPILNQTTLYDVIIKTNLIGYSLNYNLTNGNLTFEMPNDSGDFYFEVGFLDDGVFNPKYRHFFRVINEKNYTLYDMIERVRAAIPIERESIFEQTRIFELDSNLVDLFKSIEMPQMFFMSQTARQVLNTMFKYINAISRLKHMDDSDDILAVDFFNKILGEFDSNDITTFQMTQNAQDYGMRAISFLSQTLQTNFRENPSVITPANNLFKTVRSSNIQLTRDSFHLKLEKPIYELYKIEAVIPNVVFQNESEQVRNIIKNFVLDLTPRTLEKTVWDLKNKTVDIITYSEKEIFDEDVGMRLNQNSNIFWTRNGKTIDFNIVIGSTIKSTLLEEVLQEALNEELTLRLRDSDILGNQITTSNLPLVLVNPFFDKDIDIEKTFRNVKFNIEYTTLDDTIIRQERLDTEFVAYDSDLRVNNFQTVSDFGRVSRDLYGKIERSGIPNKTITKIHTSLSDVLDVGQIDSNNYIITERKMIFHNEFIEAIYTLTRNHNRLNEFNGVNQEYRAFEIPTFNESVKRLDFYSDYIYIVNPEQRGKIPYNENDTTIFDFKNKFGIPFKHLNNSVYNDLQTKITYAFVRTDGFLKEFPDAVNLDEYKAIMTPVVSFGGKNNLNFNFKFDNNQVAGDAITASSRDGSILNILKVTNYYNEPIRYTDNQGYFDKLWFGMSNKYRKTDNFNNIADVKEEYFNEGYSYPLVKGTKETLQQDFHIKNNDFFDPDWFIVYKDAATSYGFSYQLNIIPLDYRAFVVGQNFYTENPLIMNPENEIKKYLYVYENNTQYNIFDDLKIKSGYAASVELNENNFVFNDVSFTMNFEGNTEFALDDATSWAIGDEDGNLYLSCNFNYNGFGLLSRHKRLNVFSIGEKVFTGLTEINDVIYGDLIIDGLVPGFAQGRLSDTLSSNMLINGKAQQIFETAINRVLYAYMFTRVRAQTNYNSSISQTLDSNMSIQGNAQTNYAISINQVLEGEMIVRGNAQTTFSTTNTQALRSDLFIDGDAQITDTTSVSKALQSFMFISGEAQITQSYSVPTQALSSEIILSGSAQVTQSGNATTETLDSKLTISGSARTTQSGGNTIETLTSNMVIDGNLANPVFARITTDNGETIVVDVSFIFNIGTDSEFETDDALTTSSFFLVGNNNEDASVQYTVSQFWEYNGKEYEFDRARFTIGDSPEFQTLARTLSIATTDEVYINFYYNEIPKITVQAKLIDTTTGNNLESNVLFTVFDSQDNTIENQSVALDSSYGFAIDVPDATGNELQVISPESFTFGPETYVFQSYQVRREDTSLVTSFGAPILRFLITDPILNVGDTAYYDINYQRQNKYWLYLGTNTQSFNQNVNYNYSFDTCSFPYTEVESWLELNYPPRQFNPNHVIRVTVLTDSGFPCRNEYYRATPL
jgi:hypothetical protein